MVRGGVPARRIGRFGAQATSAPAPNPEPDGDGTPIGLLLLLTRVPE